MYVQLLAGGQRFLYDVGNLAELKAHALDHLRTLLPSAADIQIFYRVPVATHGDATVVLVNSESDFQVGLQVWNDSIRPLQLARQEPLLASFEAVPSSVEPNPPATTTASAAPSSYVTPKKKSTRAPAPDTTADVSSILPDTPQQLQQSVGAAGQGTVAVVGTDWYHSREKASTLLSSFAPESPTDPPTIRITLRAGQASSRIRFDPYNRPDVNELRQVVQSELLRRLAPEERDRIVAGTSNCTIKFLMYVNTPAAPVDVDVEDNTDVTFVCDEIKKYGNDYSVQLMCEWVDATEVPCAREDVRLVETDLVEVVLPPRSALTFNLAHTPKREHHEVKGIDMGEE
jgi:hypothetical protein